MLPGSREMQVSGPVKEDTVTGPKIAAVERREARVSGNNGTRRLTRGVNLLPKRRPGAPLPRACEGKEKRGTAPRLAHNRGRWRTPVSFPPRNEGSESRLK